MATARFKAYCEALDRLSKASQLEFEKAWRKLQGLPPEELRDALIEVVEGIVAKYGDMAATVAAEYYEGERSDALGGEYEALLADTVPREQIEAVVRYAAGHLFEEG